MPAEESCSACGAPITVADWMTAVPVTRDGARAHLGCLEVGGMAVRAGAWYLLAPRCMSAQWLRPGACFGMLVGDYVLIEVPTYAGLCEQRQIMDTLGLRWALYENPQAARRAALGELAFTPRFDQGWEDFDAELARIQMQAGRP